jgi:hypothetical protein
LGVSAIAATNINDQWKINELIGNERRELRWNIDLFGVGVILIPVVLAKTFTRQTTIINFIFF